MPAIKCPSCEYRNFHAASLCINCGATLPTQAPMARQSATRQRPSPLNQPITRDGPPPKHHRVSRAEPSPQNRSYARKRSSTEVKEAETVKPSPKAKAEMYPETKTYSEVGDVEPYADNKTYSEVGDVEPYTDDEHYAEVGNNEPYSNSKELIAYQQHLPTHYGLLPRSSTALEPYQISTTMELYQPQGLLPTLPTFVKEDPHPDPWLNDKLPWGFPRRPPDVAGTIIQIQQSQELPEYPNLIIGIVNMLTEIIWMIPNDTMKKEDERLQVTTIRIRTSDDEKKDARLIGYLRGANLTLGDAVSLWGWRRRGSLTVRKGYNHTSKAIVSTHTLGLVMPAMVLLVLLGIGFLLFVAWPHFSSFLSSFFTFSPQTP